MEIKLKDFFELGKIVSFVNFHGSFQKCKNSGKIAYIFDEPFLQNISVDKYLKKKIKNFSKEKIGRASCRERV